MFSSNLTPLPDTPHDAEYALSFPNEKHPEPKLYSDECIVIVQGLRSLSTFGAG